MLAGISSAHASLEQLNHRERLVAAGSEARSQVLSERHLAQQAVDLLQHEIASMTVLAALDPVRFLGVKASLSLTRGLGTSFLTAAIVLLDRVYGVSLVPYIELFGPTIGGR